MSVSVQALDVIADSHVVCDHGAVERCEVVTDFHRLQQLWPQWERLWGSDPRAEIFQTPAWARAWWHAFGHNYALCTVVVFEGSEVIGILPLVRRGRTLQFLGTPEADYADILCEEGRSAEVLAMALRTVLESIPGWDECSFLHLSRHARLVRYYQELPSSIRGRLRCVPDERQHTIILRNQREAVFHSLLGKHHTRRLQNKLRKSGNLQFRHLNEREAEQYLPEFFRHHIRRHAALGRQSLCSTPDFQTFVRDLIRELGTSEKMRFGVLELDGRALAWDLGFHVNGKFMLYQHTFDLDAWHYTPGEVLLWNELHYAKEHVSREFDFGKGDELYKDRFANYSRETFSLFLEPAGVKGSIRGWKRSLQASMQPALGKLKEMVKGQRMTLRAFRAARMWMIGTEGYLRQARKNHTLLQCGFRVLQQTVGRSILSKRSTDVFGLETSHRVEAASPGTAENNRDLEVSVALLGDLVDLAWEHPEVLMLSDLPLCRKRLKNGDRAYIARDKSEVLVLCWASSTASEAPEDAPLSPAPDAPALVIEEAWSSNKSGVSGAYGMMLAFLAREAAKQSADLLVHCSSRQPALRKELERLGFRPKFQSTRYKLFSHFRHQSVSRYPESSLHPPQLV